MPEKLGEHRNATHDSCETVMKCAYLPFTVTYALPSASYCG
jgi:hypothetical protein